MLPKTTATAAAPPTNFAGVLAAADSDRQLVTRQLIIGCVLMVVGALIGVVSVELKDTAVSAGFGTALIGAGATLLPAGASGAANSRLHGALTQLASVAGAPPPSGTPNGATAGGGTSPDPAAVNQSTAAPAPGTPQESKAPANGSPGHHILSALEADAADGLALLAERPTGG